MKQNANIQESLSQPYSAATPLPILKFFTSKKKLSNEVLYKDFPQGASEWPKDKVLDFLVYFIKWEFLATFSFDPWQFSCPFGKIFV